MLPLDEGFNGHGNTVARIFDMVSEIVHSQRRIEECLAQLTERAQMSERSSGLAEVVTIVRSQSMQELEERKPSKSTEDAKKPTLTSMWPRDIKLREGFGCETPNFEPSRTKLLRLSSLTETQRSRRFSTVTDSFRWTARQRHSFKALDTTAWPVLVFNTVSVLVLSVDLTVLPYTMVWEVPLQGAIEQFGVFANIFWTLDVILSFGIAYYKDGMEERRLSATAWHYFRGRFIFDFVIVLGDWIGLFAAMPASGGETTTRNVRILSLTKLLRCVRIFRALRLVRIASTFFDHVAVRVGSSWGVILLLFRVGVIFLALLWFNHLLACGWAGIGLYGPTDTGSHWMDIDVLGFTYAPSTESYQYWTSAHWAMAQGSVPGLIAVNTWERVASVWLRLVEKIINCTLISALSASMVGVTMLASKQSAEYRSLGLFLKTNKVSPRIAVLVRKEAKSRLSKPEFLAEEDVPVIGQLSANLRRELRLDMIGEHILGHPLLKLWETLSDTITAEICSEAAVYINHLTNDELFDAGSEAEGMYYVVHGCLHYSQNPETTMVEQYQEADVSLDTWLCEAALLMHWVHVGSAVAQSTGQLILVKAGILIDVIKRHRLVRDFALAYGTVFHEQIINTIHPNALTDLVVPGATFDTLIQRLSGDAKNIVQKAALSRELARTVHRTPYRYALHTLQEEVINGRGLLYVSGKDELRRVVDVTMSCVWSADDKMFLAVLGSIENGQAVVGCRLPAITRTNDEDAEDSLVRLIENHLAPLEPLLVTLGVSSVADEEWVDSKRYLVKSKYQRTVYHQRYLGDHHCLGKRVAPRHGVNRLAPPHMKQFALDDAFAIDCLSPEDFVFYMWVTQEEFDSWKEPQHERVLAELIPNLEVLAESRRSSTSGPPRNTPNRMRL